MRRVVLRYATFTANQVSGTDPLVGGDGCVTWHSFWENTGSAAAAYALFDTSTSYQQELMFVTLSAGESTRDYIGFHALPFVGGLFFELVSGSVDGSLVAWVDHDCQTLLEARYRMAQIEAAAAVAALEARQGQ